MLWLLLLVRLYSQLREIVLGKGESSVKFNDVAHLRWGLVQPTFIEYSDLDKRSDTDALTAAMTASLSGLKYCYLPLSLLFGTILLRSARLGSSIREERADNSWLPWYRLCIMSDGHCCLLYWVSCRKIWPKVGHRNGKLKAEPHVIRRYPLTVGIVCHHCSDFRCAPRQLS